MPVHPEDRHGEPASLLGGRQGAEDPAEHISGAGGCQAGDPRSAAGLCPVQQHLPSGAAMIVVAPLSSTKQSRLPLSRRAASTGSLFVPSVASIRPAT